MRGGSRTPAACEFPSCTHDAPISSALFPSFDRFSLSHVPGSRFFFSTHAIVFFVGPPGSPFFIRDTNLDHSIWHVFVLAGEPLIGIRYIHFDVRVFHPDLKGSLPTCHRRVPCLLPAIHCQGRYFTGCACIGMWRNRKPSTIHEGMHSSSCKRNP